MAAQAKKLGKGLSALMNDDVELHVATTSDTVKTLPINKMAAGKYQPRTQFSKQNLQELADSIRENGVLQPILVRQKQGQTFEIIAGERRFRAAKIAGLKEVPVVIRDIEDAQALEFAIIENIQRQELNPLEESAAYAKLMDEFKYTQEALAKTLGKSRSHVANLLRLNQLPDSIKGYIVDGKLSMGHAKALAASQDAELLAKQVVKEGLNVRQTEALVSEGRPDSAPKTQRQTRKGSATARPSGKEKDADILQLEEMLSGNLGLGVSINSHSNHAGEVVIAYESLVELDEVLRRLGGSI